MHRQPEHVIQFLFAEMGTTGSVDGAGRLVIKGRFQQKQVENVLRRYIGMFSFLHLLHILLLTHADSGIRHLQDM
jgi:translation initiation factor 2 subunit 2